MSSFVSCNGPFNSVPHLTAYDTAFNTSYFAAFIAAFNTSYFAAFNTTYFSAYILTNKITFKCSYLSRHTGFGYFLLPKWSWHRLCE